MSDLFKTVQDAMQSIKLAVQDLESEFKKSVCIYFFLLYRSRSDQIYNVLRKLL